MHRSVGVMAGAAVVGLIALGACTEITPPPLHDFGFITAKVVRQNDGSRAVNVVGQFFQARGGSLPDSRVPLDVCNVIRGEAPGGSITSPLPAGDSVLLNIVDGGSVTTTAVLKPNIQQGNAYTTVDGNPVPLNAGSSSLAFTIPGDEAGFPEASITALSVPALASISPIPSDPGFGDNLLVTWSPAGDDSTHIDLELTFDLELGGQTTHEGVSCSWIDDGQAEIPVGSLIDFRQGVNQTAVMTRFRTHTETLGTSFLTVLARHDTTLTVQPTAP
ncbi:MAG TPA: hypothetical protein VFK13_13865 [Gemmatimonadaceae bacterium]|nr:hypothetical protein [Gemmatimonadaceae bacterium]